MIGLFVNTQVLRTQLDGRATIADFIASVHSATIEAQENQDLPFERLLEILQPKRSLSQNPLFQVLYNHQRRRVSGNPPDRTGLQIEKIDAEVDTVKFDLALDSEEGPSGEIRAIFTYATALFEAATIERLASHWITILKAMAEDRVAVDRRHARCFPSRNWSRIRQLERRGCRDGRTVHTGASNGRPAGRGKHPTHRR